MKRTRRIRKIRLTSVQMIVLFYLGAVVMATTLLSLPFAHRQGVDWSFIDALFTAVSAISVTGLTVVSTAETFNTAGYFILAFVLQFGGIGIMTLGTFIWLLVGKKIGLRERQLIMTDQNRTTLQGLVKIMREILVLILIIEAIGTLILGLYFLNYFSTWQEAFMQGFFASVSATTNAGFDITGKSLIPFAHDYFVQFINMILLILGAIGFPVLLEIKEYLTSKERKYQFSLFTRLTTATFFILIVVGTVLILLLEWNHFYKDKTWHEALFYSLFQSVTSRNGGLATLDVSLYTEPTQLVLSVLMFIGASPSSVGGGIRTTTFAIIILSIYTFAKGNQSIKVFRRELLAEDIIKAFVVFSMAIIVCGTAVVALMVIENFPLMPVLFEVCSAFGTTGLSMGITAQLSTPGKIIIILLMFIGRVGILSFLFLIRGNIVKEKYHYPKEQIIIG
ncbi:TrkH family potassium uptake protein [Alkalihalobacillus sp. AL-G]|uniref:TrkH family potassium uptake protein n=1 Tax=Alkalihalobacillus sp. AL-G TaxID=2926399 RepID=UPI00272A39A0|nr:TrkH family potassium uptake protein [Alkalihalobacillus sp. AL-G]WLD94036.1 TrkH family potassium uptake protein [Alkalihalobacillus sp. AL-G]